MASLPANFFDSDVATADEVDDEYMDDDEDFGEEENLSASISLIRSATSLPQNLPSDFFDADGGEVPAEFVQQLVAQVHQYKAQKQTSSSTGTKKSKKQKLEEELDAFTKEISELTSDEGASSAVDTQFSMAAADELAAPMQTQPSAATSSAVYTTPDIDADEREQLSMVARLENLKKSMQSAIEQKKRPAAQTTAAQSSKTKQVASRKNKTADDDELDFEYLNGWNRTKRK